MEISLWIRKILKNGVQNHRMQEMYDLGKEDTTNLLEKLNQYIDYE